MSDPFMTLWKRLGRPPREIDPEAAKILARPEPGKAYKGDELLRLWDDHDTLLRHGDIAAGQLFTFNEYLTIEGTDDLPCGLLHSFDPLMYINPNILTRIAKTLYQRIEVIMEKKARTDPFPFGPWFQQTLAMGKEKYFRTFSFLVPPELTNGHVVYMSTPVVHRQHLAEGILTHTQWPVLAARDPRVTPTTMLVPEALWA